MGRAKIRQKGRALDRLALDDDTRWRLDSDAELMGGRSPGLADWIGRHLTRLEGCSQLSGAPQMAGSVGTLTMAAA